MTGQSSSSSILRGRESPRFAIAFFRSAYAQEPNVRHERQLPDRRGLPARSEVRLPFSLVSTQVPHSHQNAELGRPKLLSSGEHRIEGIALHQIHLRLARKFHFRADLAFLELLKQRTAALPPVAVDRMSGFACDSVAWRFELYLWRLAVIHWLQVVKE